MREALKTKRNIKKMHRREGGRQRKGKSMQERNQREGKQAVKECM